MTTFSRFRTKATSTVTLGSTIDLRELLAVAGTLTPASVLDKKKDNIKTKKNLIGIQLSLNKDY